MTEENTMTLLDSLYKQVVDGIPKVSKPVSELAYDYTKRYPDIDVAIKKMLRNQVTKINRAVGFRFVTKFGEKGIINLDRMIPAVGGVVGGGFNLAETKLIANRAYKSFF